MRQLRWQITDQSLCTSLFGREAMEHALAGFKLTQLLERPERHDRRARRRSIGIDPWIEVFCESLARRHFLKYFKGALPLVR